MKTQDEMLQEKGFQNEKLLFPPKAGAGKTGDEVTQVSEGSYIEIATGKAVTPTVTKMSKRYKNVVNPDDVIAEFGADTCRLYEMYMGPLEASRPWNPRDIVGVVRFLQRSWRQRRWPAAGRRFMKLMGQFPFSAAAKARRMATCASSTL